jgi:hypothetical protein
MIHIPRPMPAPADVQAALSKPLRGGGTELDAARNYYARIPAPTKAYEFARYKEFEVCRQLDLLFHGKCAYCESPYRAVDAQDIEHYRPKGGVQEYPTHPGYWWLAADWPNLLPSCPACNQRRKHVQYQPGMSPAEFEFALLRAPASLSGKGNAFPVRANNWVAAEGGDLGTEDPLLINPCERHPEDHFEWIFDRAPGEPIRLADPIYAFVRPRLTAGHTEDEYANASISIYGLNRSGIVRDRAAKLRELQRLTVPVVDAFVELARHADPVGMETSPLRARLATYKRNLFAAAQPDATYSSMAAAYIRVVEQELSTLAGT